MTIMKPEFPNHRNIKSFLITTEPTVYFSMHYTGEIIKF